MKKQEKENKQVPHPLNNGNHVTFSSITSDQRDVLDIYESVMKYLWKLESENKVDLKIKDGRKTKHTSRPNNKKSSAKASAKKSSRNKEIRRSSR